MTCECEALGRAAGALGQVRVFTCPSCLPVGSITWLIENGRQMDLFEKRGVDPSTRGLEAIEKAAQDPSETDQDSPGLPF